MIEYYAIIKCPSCGNDLLVKYGQTCCGGSTIDMIPETTCLNCLNITTTNFNVEKHKIYKVGDEFKPNLSSNKLTFETYKEILNQILIYIKNGNIL